MVACCVGVVTPMENLVTVRQLIGGPQFWCRSFQTGYRPSRLASGIHALCSTAARGAGDRTKRVNWVTTRQPTDCLRFRCRTWAAACRRLPQVRYIRAHSPVPVRNVGEQIAPDSSETAQPRRARSPCWCKVYRLERHQSGCQILRTQVRCCLLASSLLHQCNADVLSVARIARLDTYGALKGV